MEHGYSLDGHINGRRVLGHGTGHADLSTGVSELDVVFEHLPDLWDPRSIVLMCCLRATVMATREKDDAVGMFRASGGYVTIGTHLVNGLRQGMMRDAAGTVMVDVRASSVTDFRPAAAYDSSTLAGGVSHLRRGENGITRIKPFTGVMIQSGPRVITVTTSYEAELEDGSTLYGTTFYPHFLPVQQLELPGLQLLSVTAIDQELIGNRLHLRTESLVQPLPVVQSPSVSRVPDSRPPLVPTFAVAPAVAVD